MLRSWIVGLALVAACGSDGDGSGPVIDAVSPSAGSPGDTVELSGRRFCGDAAADANEDGSCVVPPAGVVSVGEMRASVVMWTHELVVVTVPGSAPTGATTVSLNRDGVDSNAVGFTVQ